MSEKIYSKVYELPTGHASKDVTKGCIVLEGGALRGVYVSGVLDALMEKGINFETTIGVSAGALNGFNYVAGQIGRSARASLKYRHDKRYMGIKAFKQNHGVFGFDFLIKDYNEIEPIDFDSFNDPARRFVAVASNLHTGKPAYFERGKCKNIMAAIRASASMPYVTRPVVMSGVPYLDGGCTNKIPYRWALDQGYDKVVIVRSRPETYRKKESSKRSMKMAERFYRDYPEFAQALGQSNDNYNRQCEEILDLKGQGKVFVISPSVPITVSRVERDMEKLGKLYNLGYDDTIRNLWTLHDYLES